jgi:hypothetical protein
MKTKKEEVLVEEFTLPNEIVTVKFLPRKRGMAANVGDNHVISGGMLTNAVKGYVLPRKQRGGGLANVLTKAEKIALEEETGLDLSIYGKFWQTFKVKLRKDDASNVFDLSTPMGYMSVKVLEQYTDEIAHSWSERKNKPTFQFAITRPEEVTDERKAKLDVKKEAFKLYGKMEDDKDKLLSVFKLLSNKPISDNSTLKWIQGKVEEFVDNSPSKFLSVVQDVSFETKALINKGIAAGVIKRNGNKYSTVDGLELCENGSVATLPNAVKYLENPKHQDVRDLIEAKIDNAN